MGSGCPAGPLFFLSLSFVNLGRLVQWEGLPLRVGAEDGWEDQVLTGDTIILGGFVAFSFLFNLSANDIRGTFSGIDLECKTTRIPGREEFSGAWC